MKVLNGTKKAEEILKNLKEKIKEKKVSPILAVILVGEDKPSEIYIKQKKEKAAKVGIKVEVFKFPPIVSQKEILKKINELNNNNEIDGIIVQLPLPKKFDSEKIISKIDPRKDVDGFHEKNIELLKDKKKEPFLYPVLPQAIHFILKQTGKDLKRSKITALVNSDIFGQTLKWYFKKKGINIKYSKELKGDILKKSDIIITVKGKPNIIGKKEIKKGALIIDAGFSYNKQRKPVGDVNKKEIKDKASFLTPIPGGVGPLTVAFLLNNTFLASIN